MPNIMEVLTYFFIATTGALILGVILVLRKETTIKEFLRGMVVFIGMPLIPILLTYFIVYLWRLFSVG